MKSFQEWLVEGSRWPVSYHVTYLVNINNIAETGLQPRGGVSPWQKPHLNQHSTKGVFYCKDAGCVHHWIDEMAEQAYSLSDNPTEDMLIPVVLKFNINPKSTQPDDIANAEMFSKGNYFSKRNINGAGIQVWNGRQWTTDLDAHSVDIHNFVDMGNYDDEHEIKTTRYGYPLPPELQ